ncbi:Hypothetical protein CAP_1313 [Chondromyces apiculatus DSM 436]|uniref:Uncharacterized protein n=1 Tax=Chondromyces apiculatus DSM 436 TaxID=1192034 RepID=A0A017TCX1_9BACT|nr:Hypothetical protein CAP_1313 [Chondromyces apiculatus DSM 436]
MGLLADAVRAGGHDEPRWLRVPWSAAGVTVEIGAAPLSVTAPGLPRWLPVSWDETLEICSLLGWVPFAADLADAVHAAAELKLEPVTLVRTASDDTAKYMQALSTCRTYNDRMRAQIPCGFQGLIGSWGKHWILSNRNRHLHGRAGTTYGWHRANGSPIQGLGPDGKAPAHDAVWTDYSQLLVPLRRHCTDGDGQRRELLDVYTSRGLSRDVASRLTWK